MFTLIQYLSKKNCKKSWIKWFSSINHDLTPAPTAPASIKRVVLQSVTSTNVLACGLTMTINTPVEWLDRVSLKALTLTTSPFRMPSRP